MKNNVQNIGDTRRNGQFNLKNVIDTRLLINYKQWQLQVFGFWLREYPSTRLSHSS